MAVVKSRFVLNLFLTLALFAAAAYPQRAPDHNVAKVIFSAHGKDGKSIDTLTSADVQVLDEGKAQTITSFERVTEQPISVVLLVDVSASQSRLKDTVRLTALTFVDNIMRNGSDQLAVIGFSNKATVEQEMTTDKARVVEAVNRLHFSTPASSIVTGRAASDPNVAAIGATALWDNIWNASEGLSLSSTENRRRAILLLSDGEDTVNRRGMSEAIKHAQKYEVAIFAIGMGDQDFNGVDKSQLRKLANQTGGRAFFPRKLIELESLFAKLGEELRSHYVLTYVRTTRKARGEIQKLRLELLSPSLREIDLAYRRGYVSP